MQPAFFAKSDPPYTLHRHSKDVANRTQDYIDQFSKDRLDQIGILNGDIERAAWLAGFFHDLGKSNPKWQEWVHKKIHDEFDIEDSYLVDDSVSHRILDVEDEEVYKPRHSAVSAVITISILYSDQYSISEEMAKSIFLAILHHHTGWTDDNMEYESQIEGAIRDVKKTKDNIPTELYGEPSHEVNQMMYAAREIRSNASSKESQKWDRIRLTALLLYSALRQSDWYESGIVKGEDPNFPETFEPNMIEEFDSMRDYQEMINSNAGEECLLGMAGCGEGKTYSALLWGREQSKRQNLNRLVFAMPTQVTTNNLYLNMSQETIDGENISLYHGATNYIEDLYSEADELPEIDQAELYQAPVNVTTVDHVLDTMVSNYDSSPISFCNLLSSGIVFDEIQAYDDHTTENILGCINHCRELGIPVYVMSATIPEDIREHIPKNESVVSEGVIRGEVRNPYEIEVKSSELTAEDVIKEIDDNYDKVMVVKNTVRDAQNLAKSLDDDYNVFYYSSEFSQKDRRRKEKEIKSEFAQGERGGEETKILVCTQICEISLDLSSDILLTDIAPIDSIFQRCGRLHRNGTNFRSDKCDCQDCMEGNRKYRAVVYDTTDVDDCIYPYATESDSKNFKLLSNSASELSDFGIYSFTKSVESTDRVYNEYKSEYRTDEYKINSQYGNEYFENRSQRYDIRDIRTNRVDVLLGSAETDIKEKHGGENINVSQSKLLKYYQLHSVPIPHYWVHSSDIDTSRRHIKSGDVQIPIYPELEYSYEDGVQPPKEIEEPTVKDGDGFI